MGLESVLEVSGQVVPRPDGQANHKMETGDIEVNIGGGSSILSMLGEGGTLVSFTPKSRDNTKCKKTRKM